MARESQSKRSFCSGKLLSKWSLMVFVGACLGILFFSSVNSPARKMVLEEKPGLPKVEAFKEAEITPNLQEPKKLSVPGSGAQVPSSW